MLSRVTCFTRSLGVVGIVVKPNYGRQCRAFGKGYEGRVDRVGEFKSPIIKDLWERRKEEKRMEDGELSNPIPRKASESKTCVTYDFSNDLFLRESYVNPWGFMRKGKLFEDMDALAGNVAYKHCERGGRVPLLVTASIDRIKINKNPPLEQSMEMTAVVVYTGSSSMQINIAARVTTEAPWVHANFTFVARHPVTGKAMPINPLVPETDEEKALFQDVEQKNLRRKLQRQKSQQKVQDEIGKGRAFDRQKMMDVLLQQARPLLEMPCLADSTCILVDSTRLSNSTTMQPQQRNMSNRIFGGFLARRAYEIAFSTCYLFAGSRPEFSEMLHVDFLTPVDVADLMRFDSCILYTKVDAGHPEVHIQVTAMICKPEEVTSRVSNTFNFIFKVPMKATLKKVLPSNLDQAKKIVERLEASREPDD